jgi:hypothetical protein
MLDGDGAIGDAALLKEQIVAAAPCDEDVGRIAEPDGRRIYRDAQHIVSHGGRVADVR